MNNWDSIRRVVGLTRFVQPSPTPQLCRLVEAVVALGGLMPQKGASSVAKTAGAVSLSALTASMCLQKGLASKVKIREEKTQSRPAKEQEKRSRENEPDPRRSNPSDFVRYAQ